MWQDQVQIAASEIGQWFRSTTLSNMLASFHSGSHRQQLTASGEWRPLPPTSYCTTGVGPRSLRAGWRGTGTLPHLKTTYEVPTQFGPRSFAEHVPQGGAAWMRLITLWWSLMMVIKMDSCSGSVRSKTCTGKFDFASLSKAKTAKPNSWAAALNPALPAKISMNIPRGSSSRSWSSELVPSDTGHRGLCSHDYGVV